MEHRYAIYGVSVRSDLPFEFPIHDGNAATIADVCFARGEDDDFAAAPPLSVTSNSWFLYHEINDGSIYLRWPGWYEFLVNREGTAVRYRAFQDGDAAVFQNLLFGQALSFALIRQNLEPLHASVVDIGGSAIALLGDCQYGKSTLAASLLRAGCRLVSDDLLLVRRAAGRVMASAGAGRIKLYPDSAHAFLGEAAAGFLVIPNGEKRLFRLNESLVQRAEVPLRAFVVLPTPDERGESAHIEINRVGRMELFYELVKNTFVRRVDDGRRLHHNFASNCQLASEVDGYRLRYPAGIDRLAAVGEVLLEYFADQSQGGMQ